MQTLATGVPGTYPVIADITKKSGGEIISFDESKTADVARLIAYKTQERIGPASAICMGGYFESLKKGLLKDGDVVMVNLGEGIERAPEFLAELVYNEDRVSSADEIHRFDRAALEQQLWDAVK